MPPSDYKPGTIVLGHLHTGSSITGAFAITTESIANRHPELCWPPIRNQSGIDIDTGRNEITAAFLDRTEGEWLWMCDDDMGLEPNVLELLEGAADADAAPVVGALAFALRRLEVVESGAMRCVVQPTIYDLVDAGNDYGVAARYDYPRDTVTRCDATGAACLLIHRSVLERMRERLGGDFWWDRIILDGLGAKGRIKLGEDVSFCLKLRNLDPPVPLHVHTGARTAHFKTWALDEWFYDAQPIHWSWAVGMAGPVGVWAVIPTKASRFDVLEAMLDHLDAERVPTVIVDTGMPAPARAAIEERSHVAVIDADADMNIHAWWNQGLDAVDKLAAGKPHDVAVLNDDLVFHTDDAVRVMAAAVRSSVEVMVAGPGQLPDLDGIKHVQQIDAARGGNVGLPGWCFVLRGEEGYRFDEDLRWWYGDNDLVATAITSGRSVVLALGAHVEHLGSEHAAGILDDPEMAAIVKADGERFREKWTVAAP